MIRPTYSAICDGNKSAAALLSIYEHWTNFRRSRGEDDWVPRKKDALVHDGCGLLSDKTITSGNKKLEALGFITRRERDPRARHIATANYKLNVEAIQTAIDNLPPEVWRQNFRGRDPDPEGADPPPVEEASTAASAFDPNPPGAGPAPTAEALQEGRGRTPRPKRPHNRREQKNTPQTTQSDSQIPGRGPQSHVDNPEPPSKRAERFEKLRQRGNRARGES